MFVGVVVGYTMFHPAPPPTVSTSATPEPVATQKYRLIAKFGAPTYCDSDSDQIQREKAKALFLSLQSNTEEFDAIVRYLGITSYDDHYPDDQKLAIYRQHKALENIILTGQYGGYGSYQIEYYTFRIRVANSAGNVQVIDGEMNQYGKIIVTRTIEKKNVCSD